MADALLSIVGSILGAIAAALVTAYFNRRTTAKVQPSGKETSGHVRWVLIVSWPLACSVPEAAFLSIGDDWFLVSIAIAQTVLLRAVLGRGCRWGWWWFFASGSAWLVVWYDAWFTKVIPFGFIGPAYGILAGILQWLVLRGYYWYSGWWVLISFFAWTLGITVGLGIDPGPRSATTIGLFISGVITAFPLDYILRCPRTGRSFPSRQTT